MGEAGEDDLLEAPQLLGHGGVDARIRVAEQIDPPGADRIQVALAGEILQPGSLTAADRDQGQVLLVILHLRAGVPDVREVARNV